MKLNTLNIQMVIKFRWILVCVESVALQVCKGLHRTKTAACNSLLGRSRQGVFTKTAHSAKEGQERGASALS